MSLEESEEEIKNFLGNYKITEDNYKKMILILFRIYSNIPIILMGETGCGKTELIKQLMKLLNKDKEKNNLIIINMNSNIKENEIIEIIEKAEENIKETKNDFIYIFFDEINTTVLLSQIKEIFVNHSLKGKLINERIKFIGACLPLRKNEDKKEELIYPVNSLPNSLLNYVFYFPNLGDYDTEKYIEKIIDEEFPEGENKDSNNTFLRKNAIDMIFNSHQIIKKINGTSSVSLRDIQRFRIIYLFFIEYYRYKKEFFIKNGYELSEKFDIKSNIQSIILSIQYILLII